MMTTGNQAIDKMMQEAEQARQRVKDGAAKKAKDAPKKRGYRCTATLADGCSRCANLVSIKSKEGLCGQHQAMKDAKKAITLATTVHVALLFFTTTYAKDKACLEALGAKVEPRQSDAERNKAHAEHAAEFGRKADLAHIGGKHSGRPIFDEAGVESVDMRPCLDEMCDKLSGLKVHMHVTHTSMVKDKETGEEKEVADRWMVVAAFSKEGTADPALVKEVKRIVGGQGHKHCHPWANPLNEKKEIVVTINLGGFTRLDKVRNALYYDDGLFCERPI